MNRLSSSSKGTCIWSLLIILPSFIKIGQELFELIEEQTWPHTDRHNDADENNTCPKTKFLDQVITYHENLSNGTYLSYQTSDYFYTLCTGSAASTRWISACRSWSPSSKREGSCLLAWPTALWLRYYVIYMHTSWLRNHFFWMR